MGSFTDILRTAFRTLDFIDDTKLFVIRCLVFVMDQDGAQGVEGLVVTSDFMVLELLSCDLGDTTIWSVMSNLYLTCNTAEDEVWTNRYIYRWLTTVEDIFCYSLLCKRRLLNDILEAIADSINRFIWTVHGEEIVYALQKSFCMVTQSLRLDILTPVPNKMLYSQCYCAWWDELYWSVA